MTGRDAAERNTAERDAADRAPEAGAGPGPDGAGPDGAGPDPSEVLEAGARDGGERLTVGRLARAVRGIPAFGKLLFRLLGDGRVSLLDRALFGATLVYLFVPVDLVPDWIVGLGQLDDLLLVLFTLDRLLYRTDPDVLLEHWDGDPETLLTLQDLLDRSAGRLPGWARKLLRAG